ncbi:MAG: S1C family serine protease [Thermomicrobiales bacterium]
MAHRASTPSVTTLPTRSRLICVATMLLIATLAQPLTGAAASAGQATRLPENVLHASVRIMTNIQVTPDDTDEAPFLCLLDEDTVLDYSVGSGTIITEDGFVLTNHHVMDAGRLPREVSDYCEDQAPRGRGDADWTHTVWLPDARGNPTDPYRMEVVADSTYAEDLAVIRITEHLDGSPLDTASDPFPFVEFGDSDALREPEKIILVGYPLNAGDNRRVSEGIFSGWGDNGFGVQWIYTDATISGGNSGGTAVNSEGLLIGVPTQGTFSDCRAGDTNSDGLIDENDQGCISLGGNYGILIPSNLARVFAEAAIGQEIAVVEPATPVEDEPEPVAEEPEPAADDSAVDADGPPFGEIAFIAYDETQAEQDEFQNVNWIDGCFENLTAQQGQEGIATWYLDDSEYLVTEFVWDDAWNPEACASIFIEEGEEDPFLDPGVYRLEVEFEGQTVVSDDLTVTISTNVESVSFRARDADGDSIEASSDNVLIGEPTLLYADIVFTGMAENSIWQAEWYEGGRVIVASDPEVWGNNPDGEETVRMRNPDLGPFGPGDYELVVTVDGVESQRVSFTIED